MRSRLLLGASVLTVAAACTRHAWVNELDVPGLCPADSLVRRPAPPVRIQPSALPEGAMLVARVVDAEDGSPVAQAMVYLETVPRIGRIADSTGVARLDTAPAPGRYLLHARRIGFEPRRDSVTLPLPAGTVLEVPLRRTLLDGPCSGLVAVRIRKPWWKWW
jgi:hypothetical protein